MTDFPGPILNRRDGRWAVADHGAQVLAWQPLGRPDHRPVLWFDPSDVQESPGVIRGGIPVCAPWFGHGPTDDRPVHHGLMRLTDFHREVALDDPRQLLLRYRARLPGVDVVHTVEMTGSSLGLELSLTSTAAQPQRVEAVWHSYLRVGDASRARVEGVRGASFHNFATGRRGRMDDDVLPVGIDTDTVLQDPVGALTLVDPAWRRGISLSTQGCPTAVVWNPRISSGTRPDATGAAWRDFVCVETGAAKERAIGLEPEDSVTLALRISAGPL